MDSFSISQLAQYSGIKPHTIRVWEQRYNALQPIRSEGNTRYYDSEQLRRLLNIVSLLDTKYKVSELCTMPDAQLSALILEQKNSLENETNEYFVSQLIVAGRKYDQILFEELFEQCMSKFGILLTYKNVVHPLLVRVGLLWSANVIPSAEEHFVSNIIRQKILSSINSLPAPTLSQHKWLLFLPEDEFHELGLLFASYLLRQSGNKVVYLGSSVSTEPLLTAIEDTQPDFLLLFLTHYNLPEHVQNYITHLEERFTGKKIVVAGSVRLLSQLSFTEKALWLKNINELEEFIKI